MSGKVIYLPFAEKRVDSLTATPIQADLFDGQVSTKASLVMMNPSEFNQEQFLEIVARNGFDRILDLRPRPVFRKPGYDHRALTGYLYERGVEYIDIAHVAHRFSGDFNLFLKHFSEIFRESKLGANQFSLCLFDEEALDLGVVAEFRKMLRQFGGHVIEVHPRTVFGG